MNENERIGSNMEQVQSVTDSERAEESMSDLDREFMERFLNLQVGEKQNIIMILRSLSEEGQQPLSSGLDGDAPIIS